MIGRLFAVAVAWTAMFAPVANAQQSVRAQTVVELYTSQGCSQCPRANRLIGAFAADDNVLALTFPTSIWDYLGWHDTFAQPAYSERQRAFSSALHVRRYTPQLVYNGASQMSASNWDEARAILDRTKAEGLAGPEVIITRPRSGRVRVAIGSGARRTTPADVWIVAYDPGPVTAYIAEGVNRSRRIDHYNLARWMDRAGTWDGSAMYVERSHCTPRCAVIVQEPEGGRVLSAAFTTR